PPPNDAAHDAVHRERERGAVARHPDFRLGSIPAVVLFDFFPEAVDDAVPGPGLAGDDVNRVIDDRISPGGGVHGPERAILRQRQASGDEPVCRRTGRAALRGKRDLLTGTQIPQLNEVTAASAAAPKPHDAVAVLGEAADAAAHRNERLR